MRVFAFGAVFCTALCATSAVAQTPTPLTVADIIGMTTIGSKVQGYGDEDYDVVSPNGQRIAVVVKRGDVARNTIEYVLMVFRSEDLTRQPKPDTVARFVCGSNRPGIQSVRWLRDNATLVFLGERAGELPQIYALDTRTKELAQRTHATTMITAFDVASAGDPVVYAAEPTTDTSRYASIRARGVVLSPQQAISDVISGDFGSGAPWWEVKAPKGLHIVRGEQDGAIVPLPDSAAGYRMCLLNTLNVAPTGDRAVVDCMPRVAPSAWSQYRQKDYAFYERIGSMPPEHLILDLRSGRVRPLFDAPAQTDEGSMAWAPDGRTIVLGNAFLPLSESDSVARASRHMLAEVDVETGAVTVVARRDSLTVLHWDPHQSTIETVPGGHSFTAAKETSRVYYRKGPKGWMEVREPGRSRIAPALVIDQSMSTPPTLVAIDPMTHERHIVFDPNPGLLNRHLLARETVLHWTTKAGAQWVGGLYWPLDYQPGRRYPLVIQTHGFDSTAFWPDGAFSTGEAAQPLASTGMFVLQLSMPPWEEWVTPREAPLAQEGVEGVIDHLDSLGLVDRAKVGMQGFSRTCFHVLYFLTHSHYPIAAATVTDGVDFSYLQYLFFEPGLRGWPFIRDTSRADEGRQVSGGVPFGATLAKWMERAPGFNLDKIHAPLQLTALHPGSLLEEWEPYAGLVLQGKPTEMVYIPDGEHVLTKPWERLTSQQGAVDWYRFWLQGQEDPDPDKSAQYGRWRAMRGQQKRAAAQ